MHVFSSEVKVQMRAGDAWNHQELIELCNRQSSSKVMQQKSVLQRKNLSRNYDLCDLEHHADCFRVVRQTAAQRCCRRRVTNYAIINAPIVLSVLAKNRKKNSRVNVNANSRIHSTNSVLVTGSQ